MILEIISPEKIIFTGAVSNTHLTLVNGEFEMLNNHAAIVSNLKKGAIKVYGNITLDDTQKEIFEKGDRGYHLDINSGTVEMKNNKVTALVE